MTLKIYILPLAETDFSEIGDYFDERSETLSQRFYGRFWDTANTLASSPELGSVAYFVIHGQRECVCGFSNYLLFYRVQDSTLQILRVIHGARDYAAIFNEE